MGVQQMMMGMGRGLLAATIGGTLNGECTYYSPGQSSCTAQAFPSASPSGGSGSYTYSWSWQSGGVGMTITNATSQTCTVTQTAGNSLSTGTIQCVVNDGSSSVTPTASVSLTFTDGNL
jgi:hypothetical protein